MEVPFLEPLPIKQLYDNFLKNYGMQPKDYDKTRFAHGLRYIAKSLGYQVTEGQKKIDTVNQKVMEIKRINPAA